MERWMVAQLATGAVSLTSLLLAAATAHWLNMKETCSFPETYDNITFMFNDTLVSNAGMWKLCMKSDFMPLSCTDARITEGLDKNKVKDDSQWRTGTVMETTRIQFPFTCFAVLSTICGFVCSIVGNCRGVKITLVAAVLYILSGLSLAVGVILYISRINDELSIPTKNCTDFEYRYGWSFYLMGIAFLMAEISAVISVKLYLVRCSYHISDMFHIIPELEEQIYRDACVSGIRYSDPNSQTLIW